MLRVVFPVYNYFSCCSLQCSVTNTNVCENERKKRNPDSNVISKFLQTEIVSSILYQKVPSISNRGVKASLFTLQSTVSLKSTTIRAHGR